VALVVLVAQEVPLVAAAEVEGLQIVALLGLEEQELEAK
jgi:hypothetical protein